MKRIFIKIMTVFTCSLIIIGCGNKVEPRKDKEQGKFIDVSFEEIKEKIEKKATFILQFESTTCHFCKMLKMIEKEYLKENDIDIYVFKTDKQMQVLQEHKDFFNEKFGEIKEVPITFWIFEGDTKNSLPLVEKDEQGRILRLWIQDNINYYK